MRSFDEFRAEIRRRRDEWFISELERWPARRSIGRRPRDREQEQLLAELDRARLERQAWWKTARRVPVRD